MLITKEAILLQLFKKMRGGERTPIFMDRTVTFQSSGHYDLVLMLPCQSSSSLVSQSVKNQMVEFEKMILIPASDTELEIDALFGIVTFILTDEEEQDPFATALAIEDEFRIRIQSKAFVSTSTSSISVMSFCDVSRYDVVDWLHTYIQLLEEICLEKRKTYGIYSFSIPLINLNKIENDLSLLGEHSKKFPAVSFTFARKINDNGEFEAFINKFKAGFSKLKIEPIEGTIYGADDYQIVAKNVPQKTFFSLFLPKESDFYHLSSLQKSLVFYNSPFFDTSYTSILLETGINDYGFPKNDLIDKPRLKPDVEERESFLQDFPELTGLDSYFETFYGLKRSRFTKWVYSIYCPFVALMEKLLREHMGWAGDSQGCLKEGITFFTAVFEMIESLLSTSSTYTKSPGFRKIEINIVPRLILSYQSILQHNAEYWNEEESKSGKYSKRHHLFLLTPHTGKDLRSETFFSNLPPGERLVKIRLPINYALRPITCLPVLFHEVGHYIGVRHRKRGRVKSFLTLVVKFINQSISEKFNRQDIDESPETKTKKNYFNDVLSGKGGTREQKFIFSNFAFLLFQLEKDLPSILNNMYKELRKDALKVYNREIANSDNVKKAVLEGERNAIENNFFTAVVPIVERIIKDSIGEEFQDVFFISKDRRFSDVIRQGFLSRTMIEAAENDLVLKYQRSLKDLLSEIDREDQHLNFIKRSESILSEVASDIFMIKTLDMSNIDYLLLHFEVNLASRGEDGIKSFIAKFGTSDIDNLRILAVYNVLEKRKSEVPSKHYIEKYLETIESEIVDTSKKVCLFDSFNEAVKLMVETYNKLEDNSEKLYGIEWINESYTISEMAKAMNPFYEVHKYAKRIYDDPRYVLRQDSDLQNLYIKAKKEIMNESGVSDLYKDLLRLAYKYSYQQRTKIL